MEKRRDNDKSLYQASRLGDKDAFAGLVHRYYGLICAVSYSATGNRVLSEDIAQETFLSAWRSLDSLRDVHKIRPWLCSIARHLSLKEKKRLSREVLSEQAESLVEEGTTDDQSQFTVLSQKQTEAMVWAALENIPETYREVMVLYYRQGRSISDVCKALDIGKEAALKRLSRGRKHLKHHVAGLVETTLEDTKPREESRAKIIAALGAIERPHGGTMENTTLGTTDNFNKGDKMLTLKMLVLGAFAVFTAGWGILKWAVFENNTTTEDEKAIELSTRIDTIFDETSDTTDDLGESNVSHVSESGDSNHSIQRALALDYIFPNDEEYTMLYSEVLAPGLDLSCFKDLAMDYQDVVDAEIDESGSLIGLRIGEQYMHRFGKVNAALFEECYLNEKNRLHEIYKKSDLGVSSTMQWQLAGKTCDEYLPSALQEQLHIDFTIDMNYLNGNASFSKIEANNESDLSANTKECLLTLLPPDPLQGARDHLDYRWNEGLNRVKVSTSFVREPLAGNGIDSNKKLAPNLKDTFYQGPQNGPITMVVFTDYQCPYSGKLLATLDQLREEYPNILKVVSKPFPIFDGSNLATRAVFAAGQQGKYFEMHGLLFAHSDALKRSDLLAYAKELELKMSLFERALDSKAIHADVSSGIQEAKSLGIQGTPGVIVNGEYVHGARGYSFFKEKIDSLLNDPN